MRGILAATAAVLLFGGSIQAQEAKPRAAAGVLNASPLAAPATPLVTCDPYFSIWSPADRLTDADTVHWTGKPHRLTSSRRSTASCTGSWGRNLSSAPALEQTGVTITPTQTVYEFSGDGVKLHVTFTTPALPEDVDLLSRPITYVTYRVQAEDGKSHDVRLLFEASAELTVNVPGQAVAGNVEAIDGLAAVRLGSQEQNVLKRKGDDVRIDWGYLYLAAAKEAGARTMLDAPEKLREQFAAGENAKAERRCRGSCHRTGRRRRIRPAGGGSGTCRALAGARLRRSLLDRVHVPPAASLLASQRARCGRTADGSRARLCGDHEAVRRFRR